MTEGSTPMHVYQLIEWIEAEASRGMAEGDTQDALNAIKWKIKDYNAAHKTMREHYRKHPLPLNQNPALMGEKTAAPSQSVCSNQHITKENERD